MAKRKCTNTGNNGIYINISKLPNYDSGYIQIDAYGENIVIGLNNQTLKFNNFNELFSKLKTIKEAEIDGSNIERLFRRSNI